MVGASWPRRAVQVAGLYGPASTACDTRGLLERGQFNLRSEGENRELGHLVETEDGPAERPGQPGGVAPSARLGL